MAGTNSETVFVNLTDPNSEADVIGFYYDENFNVVLVTNKYGSGYENFKKARAFLRSRRRGIGGYRRNPDNKYYLFNEDNPIFQETFTAMRRSLQSGQE